MFYSSVKKNTFKHWRLFPTATLVSDISQTHLSYTALVILYICLLELKYLNLGLLSLALGKEPLEKDWVQIWIKPVHQRASILPVYKLGPTWTKKHQATLESKKSNFHRVRILLTQTNLFTYMHTVIYAVRMIPNEIRHSHSFCHTSKSVN